jgi:enoyl-CoA hydratase/carnithine racemase
MVTEKVSTEMGRSIQSANYFHHTDLFSRGGIASLAISRCRKPVIAAIQGHAIGVGITMTLGCAIRLVSSTAKVGFVFTRRGLVMEACSSFFLPRLIGYSRATRLVTTGEILLAGDKAFGGLFTEVIDGGAEKVRERARYCAEMIASETSTVASYLCRSMIWHGPPTVEEAHLCE